MTRFSRDLEMCSAKFPASESDTSFSDSRKLKSHILLPFESLKNSRWSAGILSLPSLFGLDALYPKKIFCCTKIEFCFCIGHWTLPHHSAPRGAISSTHAVGPGQQRLRRSFEPPRLHRLRVLGRQKGMFGDPSDFKMSRCLEFLGDRYKSHKVVLV